VDAGAFRRPTEIAAAVFARFLAASLGADVSLVPAG
jgi:hypothetical protein